MKRNAFLILGLLAACSITLPIARAYPVGGNTGTLGAANAVVATNITTFGACTTLISSGLTGTVTFEESNDGNSWAAVTSFPDAGSGASGSQTVTNPSAALYQSPVSGYGFFRVRVSSYGTGSATATVNCNNGSTTASTVAIASLPPVTVNTAAPAPSCSPSPALPCNVMAGPSAEPAGATGYYVGTVSSGGVQAHQICDPNAVCVKPTASPNGSTGGTLLNLFPISPCNNSGGTDNCQSFAAANADNVGTGAMSANTVSFRYGLNPGGTWDRLRTAVSPAPTGVGAIGWNAAGAAAPVICTQRAHISLVTVQPTETVLVPSAAGKTVYICSVTAVLTGTVAGLTALGNSVTNTCGANASTILPLLTPNGNNQVALGTGMGEVGVGANGDALCAFLGGTPALTDITVMYEQI